MSNLVIRIDDEEVLRAFEDLAEHAMDALEETVRDCAQIIVESANQKAVQPVVESKLTYLSNTQAEMTIGVPRDKYYIAIFETGAQPHEVNPHKKQSLFFKGEAGEIFTRAVNHPGMPARPFLRPALDESENKVKDLAAKKILLYRVK